MKTIKHGAIGILYTVIFHGISDILCERQGNSLAVKKQQYLLNCHSEPDAQLAIFPVGAKIISCRGQ